MIKMVAVALTLLPTLAAAQSINLSVLEPAYIAIDGRFYGFGLRVPTPTTAARATLFPINSDGFHLQSIPAFGACARSFGGVLTTLISGQPGLSVSDTPSRNGGSQFALPTTGTPTLSFGHCLGADVLIARSLDGDLRCDGYIRFPFQRGACPQIDAVRRQDPAFVFDDTFEAFAAS